ncbi:IS630 family transposase [Saccharolobus solfataricus]|uniref:Second ORF in transposon ISC1395 n=2 Tax=Saccharolobus solfataricus TaxID=2287 RepID=Q97XI6_SACS2|nr:Second ORF in transposon ISC1395 [Saccharolobus solfataricus P2]AYN75625.1 IS630 family transposase [Saccharolobus solfataricus]AYN75787.1 IS630 family transposase [Saccharolobus solfataricus]AYP18622.1 IS630 family transposase [Saccharolobus solfataricus]AZF69156.1 IS630 family transposase [Saccharolobus solfataricus]
MFFTDESGIHHDPSKVRRLGLYNVPVDYPSRKLNVLASIPLFDGVPCFMFTYSNVNSEIFAEFLRLFRNSGPIVLILDNAKFHKNAYVFSVASQLGITLLFLPPYSPDLNPIELVWKDLKRWVNTYYNLEYTLDSMEEEFYYLFLRECSQTVMKFKKRL